LNYFYI